MKGDREKCIDAGASDYIAKPIETEELLSLLVYWCAVMSENNNNDSSGQVSILSWTIVADKLLAYEVMLAELKQKIVCVRSAKKRCASAPGGFCRDPAGREHAGHGCFGNAV